MKKGIFFTIDSILAATIIVLTILLASKYYINEKEDANILFASNDMVRTFSELRINELDNDYVDSLIALGEITNLNNTIIEQIGQFWSENKIGLAANFSKNLTEDLIPKQFGISILVDNELIYWRNKSVDKSLASSRKLISGITKAKPTEGFTSRVLLKGIKSKTTNAYAYFGGYEGDGNLTKKLVLPKDLIEIKNVTLEVDAGGNFDLYVNNAYSGSYTKGSAGGGNMLADKFQINSIYYDNFVAGENIFTINFTSGNDFIAGGFLRVRYTTSSFNDTIDTDNAIIWLPGIDGFINFFGSIYSPGILDNMEIYLDFNSNYLTFMKIGNTTILNNNTNGRTIAYYDNKSLAQIFSADGKSYADISKKTLPVRLGIFNATVEGNADVMLVTDVSGSMESCSGATSWVGPTFGGYSNSKGCLVFSGSWYWLYFTGSPSGYVEVNRTTWNPGAGNLCGCRYYPICNAGDLPKIELYKNAANSFSEIIFNISGSKLGLVEYTDAYAEVWQNACSLSESKTIPFPDGIARTQDLTVNQNLMKNTINSTKSWWNTCICCGVTKATQMFNAQSSAIRNKTMVVMSDGQATHKCDGTYNPTEAKQEAITAAQNACNQGIVVYTVSFGADADTTTLQSMACGGGIYSSATNPQQLETVYNQIAGEITQLSYKTQQPSLTFDSSLSANSYIQLNYSEVQPVFNKLPIGFETDRFGNNVTTGALTIYQDTSVLDARVTSYSSDKWTDNLVVNSNQIYRLSDFEKDYALLGDPYTVEIPAANLNTGSNSLTISTGTTPTNNTGGSKDNRVIYTLLLNAFTDFTPVVGKSQGCNWKISFEDDTSSIIKIPQGYTGSDSCNYTAAIYEQDDAIDISAYNLLSNLDIDKDGLVDVNLAADNFDFSTSIISKVPSLWGPAIVEIRVWE